MSFNTKITKINFLAVHLLFLLTTGYAYEKEFPPYAIGKFPPTCQINKLSPLSETDRDKGHFKSTYRLADQGAHVELHLEMSYQKHKAGVYARLNSAFGRANFKPVKVGGHPSYINSVYWGYLNKDNHKDLIVIMKSGDGYLSGGRETATFFLSTKQGYGVRQLAVYNFQPEDFYDYSTDNKCEYLHQALVSDSDRNSYWVYNVLQFIDGKIVIKNQLSRYFPKWIRLTLPPNSKRSVLSKKRMEELSKAYKLQSGLH